jgi:hypothetical protein
MAVPLTVHEPCMAVMADACACKTCTARPISQHPRVQVTQTASYTCTATLCSQRTYQGRPAPPQPLLKSLPHPHCCLVHAGNCHITCQSCNHVRAQPSTGYEFSSPYPACNPQLYTDLCQANLSKCSSHPSHIRTAASYMPGTAISPADPATMSVHSLPRVATSFSAPCQPAILNCTETSARLSFPTAAQTPPTSAPLPCACWALPYHLPTPQPCPCTTRSRLQ